MVAAPVLEGIYNDDRLFDRASDGPPVLPDETDENESITKLPLFSEKVL